MSSTNKINRFFLSPARLIVFSFVAVIILGVMAFLLFVTIEPDAGNLTLSDALFTTTSAVCVTGLTVRDTGVEFNFVGQAIVLILIQIGGIGILTFSNLVVLLRKNRIGPSGRFLLAESYGMLPSVSPAELVKSVIGYTFLIEFCGAIILTLRFLLTYQFTIKEAIWLGVFHSISAYCNAGFSLFSNSLISYSGDWIINLTIMLLIIFGGIGFIVSVDLKRWLMGWYKTKKIRLSLHSRVVLSTSIVLVAGGSLLCFFLELTGEAFPTSLVSHMMDSFFLSITARTAGFNTVDTAQLTNATLFVLIILMFIGGSPGSTAGGIKTTSLMTIVALFISRMRNRPQTEIFDRRLPNESVAKALATMAAFLVIIISAVIILQITELYGVPHAEHRGKFLEYLFEVVSALATVGLSTGITTTLSVPGRMVIILCMFMGRLGPVLIASSFVGKKRRLEYSYAKEDIIIG